MVILNSSSVYLLAGTEQFLKQEHLAKIKSTCLESGSSDFNFHLFYAGSAAVEKILECACTAPLFSKKRLVLVRQIEQFAAFEQKHILSYLKHPHNSTVLVLETSETKLAQKFLQQISRLSRVILCQPLQGKKLRDWINDRLREQGKKIAEPALRLIVDNLNNNLQLLASALDNLILYIDRREKIELSDVQKLVGPDVRSSAFELFEAITVGDRGKSWQILDGLLKDGVNSAQILGALAYRVTSQGEARRAELQELQRTDWNIKSGRQSQRLALELMLARMLSR